MLSGITMTGVVEKAPEVRYTESNLAVASFPIIFNQEEMKSIKCAIFGKKAEEFRDIAGAGTKVVLVGSLVRQSKDSQEKPAISVQSYEIISRLEVPQETEKNCEPKSELESDDLIGEEEVPF